MINKSEINKLTSSQVERLIALNDKLRSVEFFIYEFIEKNESGLLAEVAGGLISDYDFEFEIVYTLSESDLAWDSFDNGVLSTRRVGCLYGKRSQK